MRRARTIQVRGKWYDNVPLTAHPTVTGEMNWEFYRAVNFAMQQVGDSPMSYESPLFKAFREHVEPLINLPTTDDAIALLVREGWVVLDTAVVAVEIQPNVRVLIEPTPERAS